VTVLGGTWHLQWGALKVHFLVLSSVCVYRTQQASYQARIWVRLLLRMANLLCLARAVADRRSCMCCRGCQGVVVKGGSCVGTTNAAGCVIRCCLELRGLFPPKVPTQHCGVCKACKCVVAVYVSGQHINTLGAAGRDSVHVNRDVYGDCQLVWVLLWYTTCPELECAVPFSVIAPTAQCVSVGVCLLVCAGHPLWSAQTTSGSVWVASWTVHVTPQSLSVETMQLT
jgi:hypothetical protein